MIEAGAHVLYSLTYVGISYADRARTAGIEVAAVQNRNGSFALPTTGATLATATALENTVPDDGLLPMIYLSGPGVYPLVNYEYAIVKTKQRTPGTAAAMRDFIGWVVSAGSGNDAALLGTVHFAPLPERVRAIAQREIVAITRP